MLLCKIPFDSILFLSEEPCISLFLKFLLSYSFIRDTLGQTPDNYYVLFKVQLHNVYMCKNIAELLRKGEINNNHTLLISLN